MHQPKDLTSTLTHSSVNNFAGKSANSSLGSGGTNSWMTSTGNSMRSGMSNSTTTPLHQNQPNSSAMSNNRSKPMGGYHASGPMLSGSSFPTNNFSQQSSRMPLAGPNMQNPSTLQKPSPSSFMPGSSLDNLLGMPQTRPQVMNRMQQAPQQYGMQQRQMMPTQLMHNSASSNMNSFTAANPFLASQNTNSNPTNSTNPLSKQDLLDFLG